ncbi:ATP phosphoribosyltransferase regulatory subunit [Lachnospiraceae bacterium C7]|nr:ATP phosphoribosyltransferase regulatory subunit [Lachnospiraceae bacterium C7]
MGNQILHTPDGVRDIYNGECKRKLKLQEKLHDVLIKYGFCDIQTPTFEFFDVFDKQVGTTSSKNLYKFIDKEGNTLVLRPDFTPSIARCVAKYYSDETLPVKICYMGNTFTNSSAYQGRLKETTQCGAENLGDSSTFADAEMLALAVESLKTAGLNEFQISVGHASYYDGLVQESKLEIRQEEELKNLITNKNFLGVEEFVDNLEIDDDLKKLYEGLGVFNISIEQLENLEKYAQKYKKVKEAIVRLKELYKIIKLFKVEQYISFELGIISEHKYYTGVIFQGYTYGTGEPIIKGGRYDKLVSYFGKKSPAIGFAIVVDQVMSALDRQKKTIEEGYTTKLLVFSKNKTEEAVKKAMELRSRGENIQTVMELDKKTVEEYEKYAKTMDISEIIYIR